MESDDKRVGEIIGGKWRVDTLLGAGAMAAVYAVTHRNGSRAALKILHASLAMDDQVCERFLGEGYLTNAVKAPGIVKVFDDGMTEDGCPFLAMDLLEGETLHDLRQRRGGKLSTEETLGIADSLMETLAIVHVKGIVHRDLKPENVFITDDGEVKILDFGVAKLHEQGASSLSIMGAVLGTPSFMAPEQALGERNQVDAKSDIWAVGAIMFTLITGEVVHVAPTIAGRLLMASSQPARPIQSVVPDLPQDIALVIDTALQFKKENRWQRIDAMRAALAHVKKSLPPTSAGDRRSSIAPKPETVRLTMTGGKQAPIVPAPVMASSPMSETMKISASRNARAILAAAAEKTSARPGITPPRHSAPAPEVSYGGAPPRTTIIGSPPIQLTPPAPPAPEGRPPAHGRTAPMVGGAPLPGTHPQPRMAPPTPMGGPQPAPAPPLPRKEPPKPPPVPRRPADPFAPGTAVLPPGVPVPPALFTGPSQPNGPPPQPRAVQPSFHDVTPRPASYHEQLAPPRPRAPSFSDQSASHSIPGVVPHAIPGDPTYAPLESNVDDLVFDKPRTGSRLAISIAFAVVAALIGFATVLFLKRTPAPVKTPAADPTAQSHPVVLAPRTPESTAGATGHGAAPIVATVSAPPSATVIRFEDLPVSPPAARRAPARAQDAGTRGAAPTPPRDPPTGPPEDP